MMVVPRHRVAGFPDLLPVHSVNVLLLVRDIEYDSSWPAPACCAGLHSALAPVSLQLPLLPSRLPPFSPLSLSCASARPLPPPARPHRGPQAPAGALVVVCLLLASSLLSARQQSLPGSSVEPSLLWLGCSGRDAQQSPALAGHHPLFLLEAPAHCWAPGCLHPRVLRRMISTTLPESSEV